MEAEDRLRLLLDRGKRECHDSGRIGKGEKNEVLVDEGLVRIGSEYFHRHFFSMFVCMLTGLLSLMFLPGIVTVLHLTGKSSSPVLAFRRYLGTIQHSLLWYDGLPSLRKSLSKVLGQHRAADTLARKEIKEEVGISQHSMVLTQWAFIGPALLWPKALGLPAEDEKGLEGVVCIMAEVGRLLGVRDDINLCTGGLGLAREYSRLLLQREILPGLSSPSPLAENMATQLLEGVAILNPFIQPVAFRAWVWDLLHGREAREGRKLAGASSYLYTLQASLLSSWFHLPIISSLLRPVANTLMKLNISLASTFEDWVVKRVQDGPIFPGLLEILEPFFFIPVLLVASFVKMLKVRISAQRNVTTP